MADKKTLLHIRSNMPNVEGNGPKLPTPEQIEYGEIAINYLKDNETISIKNSKNEIVTFNFKESQNGNTDITGHITNYNNPHRLSKTNIEGLNNIDNTSDYEKPLSTALIEALKTKMGIDELYNVNNTEDNANLQTRPTSASSGKIMKDTIDAYGGDWEENRGKIIARIEALENQLINYQA